MEAFMRIRFSGQHQASWGPRWEPQPRSFSLGMKQMRDPGSYAAMLILHIDFGATAFATAEDPMWRVAYSPGGIEDAIHVKGQFYSVSCFGDMEVWKYGAEASKMRSMMCAFRVYILDVDGRGAGRQWKESKNIVKSALFVGLNNSLCVSTRQHLDIKSNRIYFTDDELEHAVGRSNVWNQCLYNSRGYENRCIGVYNIKKHILKKVKSPMEEASFWPPAVWFSPS
ncbi:hypothetical protein BRADI_4g18950v3 [Brachypodium distachyon]|uniref:KIB1-4 beta-propeller domain-containing protein n=1 Tax=Brachypodium distachyon TaxID=15368 RepID=A0A0Q3ELR3_BRADI|nr:hypothetical protein BRADI_4g18950v3 [Brachypodium distachyon]